MDPVKGGDEVSISLWNSQGEIMKLAEYFENTRGTAVFATADGDGRVDSAIYSHPHCLADGTLGFVMADKRSHRNLLTNGQAAYLFIEEGGDYQGVRLQLDLVEETSDPELVNKYHRHPAKNCVLPASDTIYFVTFKVKEVRKLVGDDDPGFTL